MAPGLKLQRSEKGAGESCTAAEETRERTSTLLYISVGCRYGLSSFSPLDMKTNTGFFPSRLSNYFRVRQERDDVHLHIQTAKPLAYNIIRRAGKRQRPRPIQRDRDFFLLDFFCGRLLRSLPFPQGPPSSLSRGQKCFTARVPIFVHQM